MDAQSEYALLPFHMQLMARLEGGRPLGTIPPTPLANLGGTTLFIQRGLQRIILPFRARWWCVDSPDWLQTGHPLKLYPSQVLFCDSFRLRSSKEECPFRVILVRDRIDCVLVADNIITLLGRTACSGLLITVWFFGPAYSVSSSQAFATKRLCQAAKI